MNNAEILEILIRGLSINDPRLLKNVLEAIGDLLKLDITQGFKNTENSIASMFDKKGGLDQLEEA